MRKNWKILAAGAMAVGAACAAALVGLHIIGGQKEQPEALVPEEQKLVVYTSHEAPVYGPIIKEFEERTGIWVETVAGSTNELLAQISREAEEPKADIMFGGGVDSLTAYDAYFQSYVCKQQAELDDTYVSEDNKWTVFSSLPIAFVYNKKLVYSVGVPRSWEELLTSYWKGKIAFADPTKSGSSYTALATLLQIEGTENLDSTMAAFVENLDGNLSGGSADVITEVMSGTRMVGITLDQKALTSMQDGADMGMIYPSDGTSVLPDGCAILKDCAHQENARLFLEFTVSRDVQSYIADCCYRRPVRKELQEPFTEKEIEYDVAWAAENQGRILEKWASLTGQ